MQPAFIGVDVAFAKGKRLPIAICIWQEGRCVPLPLRRLPFAPPRGHGNVAALDADVVATFAREAREYITEVCRHEGLAPTRIAIDARSRPCSTGGTRRDAELALDVARISCFATPTAEGFALIREKVSRHLKAGGSEARMPHSNQLWMLVGFVLYEELAHLAPCLEVFPQATVHALGVAKVHKSNPGAVETQLRAAARYTGWPRGEAGEPYPGEIAWGAPDDQVDAYLSAWVAALEDTYRVAYGNSPTDSIWVPRVVRLASDYQESPPANTLPMARRVANETTRRAKVYGHVDPSPRVCPACGLHTFRRWPWGWDAHAAHKCAGLSAQDPEARKAEYRARFGEHFDR
jgi:hypothetical protein